MTRNLSSQGVRPLSDSHLNLFSAVVSSVHSKLAFLSFVVVSASLLRFFHSRAILNHHHQSNRAAKPVHVSEVWGFHLQQEYVKLNERLKSKVTSSIDYGPTYSDSLNTLPKV